MFRNLKLGQKIGLGFACLIIIALFLGGLAVFSMNSVKSGASKLAKDFVPSVAVASNIERFSLLTMYDIRGYSLNEEDSFLQAGLKNLEEVKKYLTDATNLSGKSKNLTTLKQNAAEATAKVTEYEQLVKETSELINKIKENRRIMNESSAFYMQNCSEFIKMQEDALSKESGAKLKERAYKIKLVNEIISLGNSARIATWKAQSLRDPQIIKDAQADFEQIMNKLAELKPITRQEVNIKQIEECEKTGKNYQLAMNELLVNWERLQEVGKKRTEVASIVLEAAKNTATAGMEDVTKVADNANLSLGIASITMLIGLLAAVILGIVLALIITKSITGPINKVIEGLSDGSDQVAAASNQVSSSSQQLAEGASEQASSLEEVSSSLEEMTSMTKQNTENAKQADIMARDAQKAAEKGSDAMIRMSDAINRIKSSSDETAKIIKTIDEIAFQTNLLALNAAVEAARAGEAGMGFAVVADEVRNLAQRSAEAAKNTASLIEESQSNADNGVSVSKEVGVILSEIADVAQKVARLIGEVSAASDEQSQGIVQLNTAVSQMDKVTQSAAASAEESASASEELSSQASELQNLVLVLVDIIGKTSENGKQPKGLRSHKKANLGTKTMKALTSAPNTNHIRKTTTTNKDKAEDIIPLDDDFDQF